MTDNRLVLGTSKLGRDGSLEHAFALLDAFTDLGGTTLDTASVYSDWAPGPRGRSETALGEWLRARGGRDRLTITTKGGHPPVGEMHKGRCDPASIRHDCELSLRRLGTDYIDLYYLHRDEPSRPAAEIVGTLQTLQKEGKIRAFGGSNWSRTRIAEALAVPGPTFTASQVLGNAFCLLKTPNRDRTTVAMGVADFHQAREANLRLDLYSAQALGFLMKRARGASLPVDYDNPPCLEAAAKVETIAKREGLDANLMILAYLIALGPNIRPVIGPHNADQLRAAWPAGEMVLERDLVREIAATVWMSDVFS